MIIKCNNSKATNVQQMNKENLKQVYTDLLTSKIKVLQSLFAACCLFILSTATLQAAIIATTTDSIDSPDYFTGFESLPATSFYAATHTEDNIQVIQVNGNPNNIVTTTVRTGLEGSRSWYPNGGDNGYTRITLTDGGTIEKIGLLTSSGGANRKITFQLRNEGVIVSSGVLISSSHSFTDMNYLGFTGGGFDEVRLKDIKTADLPSSFSDGTANALLIDAIEVVIPGVTRDPVLEFEEPLNGGISNGISNVRGWMVSDIPVARVDLYIDGALYGEVPYGGVRPDVAGIHPTFPDSDKSGFSLAYGYFELSVGPHSMQVKAYDAANNLLAEKTSAFNLVAFGSDFIRADAPIDLSGVSFAKPPAGDSPAGLKRFRMDDAVLNGTSYDLLFEWNSATQKFEMIEINH